MTTVKKVKTVAAVFELPQKLGILQYVEYEPPPKEWCTNDGCLYEGLLTAEGCRRGVCLRYRVWVHSRDNPSKAYCVQDGSVREVRLELEFKRYEEYEEKIREVYRPKGLLAYAAAAREYVKIL